jgi:hypothetical protein
MIPTRMRHAHRGPAESDARPRFGRRSVWVVAAVALVFHGVWIGSYLAAGHQARDFIKIGIFYEGLSHSSRVIKVDPTYVPPRNREAASGNGYDGQFSYYMALDFTHAHDYMDYPSYRYSRVLYPIAARALAFGDPVLVPASMIVVNWLSLGGLALALAAWLRRRSCSPWYALAVGLYPGLLVGVQRDLNEPLAYALVAAAIYFYDFGGKHRHVWAGLVFGLAGLARLTTLVFPLCLVAFMLVAGPPGQTFRHRLRANAARSGMFAFLSFAPFVIYAAFLYAWLGSVANVPLLERVPFEGLIESRSWALKRQGVDMAFILLPSLVAAGTVIAAVRAGFRRVEFAYLILNVVCFVVLLHRLSYGDGYPSAGRITTGVVLAAVLCLPWLRAAGRNYERALVSSLALWLIMLPVIFVYGFGG